MASRTLTDVFELTAAGVQYVLHGAERIRPAVIAKRRPSEPLRPNRPQAPCGFGMFSNEGTQLDLGDALARPRASRVHAGNNR